MEFDNIGGRPNNIKAFLFWLSNPQTPELYS